MTTPDRAATAAVNRTRDLSVKYFQLHIGDYAKATGHLSALEEGIYFRLLRIYYDSERPLPNDIGRVQRLARAMSDDEKHVVQDMLDEFFVNCDDGWHHNRADEELQKFYEKSEKARISAEIGWSKRVRKPSVEKNECERIENACDPLCDGNATHNPIPITHNPNKELSTSSDVEGIGQAEPPLPTNGFHVCPTAKIVDLYHKILPKLPRVEKITAKRRGQIQQRWREDLPTMEHWENFFADVSASDFLMGRSIPVNGRTIFRADIEFLTNASNFAKISEGKYHR